jgi:hypothetical protein
LFWISINRLGSYFPSALVKLLLAYKAPSRSGALLRNLRDFAYKNAPHRAVIEDTKRFDWYSEELFARFDLINTADFPYVH